MRGIYNGRSSRRHCLAIDSETSMFFVGHLQVYIDSIRLTHVRNSEQELIIVRISTKTHIFISHFAIQENIVVHNDVTGIFFFRGRKN